MKEGCIGHCQMNPHTIVASWDDNCYRLDLLAKVLRCGRWDWDLVTQGTTSTLVCHLERAPSNELGYRQLPSSGS